MVQASPADHKTMNQYVTSMGCAGDKVVIEKGLRAADFARAWRT
jgi:hypothetical protein